MRIALVAPCDETVPPKKYGGIELVVYNIAEELVRMGEEVTLFASGDSRTSAELVKTTPEAVRVLPTSREVRARVALTYQGMANALTVINEENFDVVHNHMGWNLLMFKGLIKAPIITTLHGQLLDATENLMYSLHRDSNYVSISDAQRNHANYLNYMATVYNGIDTTKFEYGKGKGGYCVFLGRISPEKGIVQAIDIARRTKQQLVIAAKIDPMDQAYFDQTVKPLLDDEQIRFIGEVDHQGKVDLLKNATALISPIQWDEPFGLVNIEAMACGTPVVTLNRGSIPEIIENKRQGFICESVDEMVKALNNIDQIDRRDCRKHVEERFTARIMAEHYAELYETLIQARKREMQRKRSDVFRTGLNFLYRAYKPAAYTLKERSGSRLSVYRSKAKKTFNGYKRSSR